MVVNLINNNVNVNNFMCVLVMECREMMKNLDEVRIEYCYRERNKVVDIYIKFIFLDYF